MFSDEQCDALVALGDHAVEADGASGGEIEGLSDAGELRESSVSWVPRDDGSAWAFERLEVLAAAANQVWGLDIEEISEDIQYTLYDRPGAHYTWHHDGLGVGVDDRKLSLVVQLSDPVDYTGGDLEFLEVATDYDDRERANYLRDCRSRGTVIAFCAFEYHRVTPITSGVRRSMVAWVSGPRLR